MPLDVLKLKAETERLVLLDISFQDPMLMFCEVDISVMLFEHKKNMWLALIDVEAPGTDVLFFEIAYLIEDDQPHVLSYTPRSHNPYTRRNHDQEDHHLHRL